MSNSERIAQVRARLAAATPGPWYASTLCCADRHFATGPVDAHIPSQNPSGAIDAQVLKDAEFIANAPDDIAWLLAERDALKAKLATAVELLGMAVPDLSDARRSTALAFLAKLDAKEGGNGKA